MCSRRDMNRNAKQPISLGRLIHQLSGEMRYWIGRELQPYGLGKIDFDILSIIEQHSNMTQEMLVDIAGVEKSVVAKSLRRLEEKRIIVRRKDSQDRRRRLIESSEGSVRFFPVLTELRTQITEVLAQDIDRDLAADLLTKMAESLHQHVKGLKEEKSVAHPAGRKTR